ncbi:MAG TPA: ATP-binding cassette domain-containing protein, partial [bacterium]|nr:ATP-binding cassette domain-containing protein [bacterium]
MRNVFRSGASAAAVSGPAALEWRDVTLGLGDFAVREVSLRLEAEGWLAVVGPTGAGKTLLLEIAAGFLRPSFGCVLRSGRDVTDA